MIIKYYTDPDIRVFVLVGGITTFPIIALPTGWWIYNIYRVCWLYLTKGGYEKKEFVNLVRQKTMPFYSPALKSILINFSHIKDIESWIKFDPEVFRKTFYPFSSKSKFLNEIERIGIRPKFTELLSDIILFKDKGYDYARSISSVRYGIESSIFALVISCIYTGGIKYIWLYNLNLKSNYSLFIFWIILISLLSLALIIAILIRWHYADKEYDARLLLTTVTSLKINSFNKEELESTIPSEIFNKIDQLHPVENSYAAFDLDNTLLINDIGDAVFAALVKNKIITNLSWEDYLILLSEDRELAYKKVIETMNGLRLEELKKITLEVLNSQVSFIDLGNYKIPVPKPNPIMQSIVSQIKIKGIDVYVITASNKISAEVACWKFFGIPASNVIGIDMQIDNNERLTYKPAIIPFARGKVTLLERRFNRRPIITAGDGIWDKFLLEYTDIDGIRLWLGQDDKEYIDLKNNLFKDLPFFQIRN